MVLVADSSNGAARLKRLAQEHDGNLAVTSIDNVTQMTAGVHLAICPLSSGFVGTRYAGGE